MPKVSDAISFWVWAIFSGAAVALFSYVINVPITKTALYQQLFPVTVARRDIPAPNIQNNPAGFASFPPDYFAF